MALATNYYDHTDPLTTLRLSQKASSVLAKSSVPVYPLSIISAAESPENWAEIEQTFYACLRTGDDKSAHLCLERVSKRFGNGNERVLAMRGLYQEAVAENEEELKSILQEYNKILENNPMNVPIHKRRIALIRSIGRSQEAILSLTLFLESFPTDTEAWCELADLYQSQGLYPQAIFSLEEALLTVPNSWNLQAKLGELNYMANQAGADGSPQQYLEEAIHRFSRSIELCDDYLRGYYGLKKTTDKALSGSSKATGSISQDNVQRLNKLATDKLRSIIQQWSSLKDGNSAFEAEIIAAQALLDKS